MATGCLHVTIARRLLRKCLKIGEGDEGLDGEDTGLDRMCFHPSYVNREFKDNRLKDSYQVRFAASVAESVSYKALPPPIWSAISSDGAIVPPPILRSPPIIIKLDQSSSCSCSNLRTSFDPTKRVETRCCTIYGLLEAFHTVIEVQKCASCRHGYVGPDCTDLGIFNLNNVSLFTLALLDDYTSQFSRSETPFISWVSTTDFRYQNHLSKVPFIKEKVFRRAWFSYIRLVRLEDDMRCTTCGPSPNVTIWDGVTLAFSRRNILQTLRPPTATDGRSAVRNGIRPQRGLQLIEDAILRKDIQFVLNGQALALPKPVDVLEGVDQTRTAALEMMDRIERIPGIVSRLDKVDAGLGKVFDGQFGISALMDGKPALKQYKNLFRQVCGPSF